MKKIILNISNLWLDANHIRLEKKLHRAGDDQDLRARAEGDERARWMLEIRKLLREAEAQAMVRGSMFAGVNLSRRFGKGRRASTLREHAKTWMKVIQWMKSTFFQALAGGRRRVCPFLGV